MPTLQQIKNKASDWRTWLHGLIGAVIGGCANAITAMVIEPSSFNFDEGWPKLWHFTLISGLVSGALYLKQSPLPPETTTTDESTP